jgi:peptide/nickel transport system substrate-binding protein
VDNVFFGKPVILDTYLPSTHPDFNDNVPRYSYDVDAASTLLEEVGWIDTNGDGIREYTGEDPEIPAGTLLAFSYLTIDTNEQRQQTAKILENSMAECGIRVNLAQISLADFNARNSESQIFGRQFDLIEWSTNLNLKCNAYLSEEIPGPANFWGGLNISGYSNPNFDALCKLANDFLPGQLPKNENQIQAQAIFAEELPAIPLFIYSKVAVSRPDLCNFILDPTDSDFWNIEAFEYGNCGDE